MLVMTSGNWSEEPIARENAEAIHRLSPLADAFLMHDRNIHVVADDSVVRVFAGRELPLRRSRGYAPLPVRLAGEGKSLLAVGGELKATFCLTKGAYAYLSQHIGDVGNLETQQAFERAVEHFTTLFRVTPEEVICDLHPGYLSTAWAGRYAATQGIPLKHAQHHHAHVAALMAEHGLDADEPFLGVAFDGTGYGHDGAIWGSEFLQFHRQSVTRVGHLRYVPLPGGDAAIRHPWRVAVTHLRAADFPASEIETLLPGHSAELPLLLRQLDRNLHCVPSSSMGRLFDAAAALLGLRHSVTFEAQAALQLEALCAGQPFAEPYPFEVVSRGMDGYQTEAVVLDPQLLWRSMVTDLLRGVSLSLNASRFHATIAAMILSVCNHHRQRTGVARVGLTGGVFQNLRLLEEAVTALQSAGFRVFHHQLVPPNDGGIALGQAWIARQRIRSSPADYNEDS